MRRSSEHTGESAKASSTALVFETDLKCVMKTRNVSTGLMASKARTHVYVFTGS